MKPEDLLSAATNDAVDVMVQNPHNAIESNQQVRRVWLKGYRKALAHLEARIQARATDWKIWQQDEVRDLDAIAEDAEKLP